MTYYPVMLLHFNSPVVKGQLTRVLARQLLSCGHSAKIFIDKRRHSVSSLVFFRMAGFPTYSPPASPPQPLSRVMPEHRAIQLSAALSFLSPRPLYTSAVTPFTSPCSSPPPTIPSSGYLEEAKAALAEAVAKRHTKASNITIDEDMRIMCHYYGLLGTEERQSFLLHLCMQHSTDHVAVAKLCSQMPDTNQPGAVVRWEERLRQCLQPGHAWVMTQLSRLTGGVKFLVDLRHDVLVAQSTSGTTTASADVGAPTNFSTISIFSVGAGAATSNGVMHPSDGGGCTVTASSSEECRSACLRELDATLREMLSLWFTVGLLQLARVTWESSCNMLQKISEYEAVHPVRNWTDLKRRVGPYRRCFVFTHSCMPSEPLVVLHTFLTDSVSSSMTGIVRNPRFEPFEAQESRIGGPKDAEDTTTITAAVFYSITSTQKGLQGIELGNYLIKRVVQELLAELPGLTVFSSLSPVPGFTKWLGGALARGSRGELHLFTDAEVTLLSSLLNNDDSLVLPCEDRSSPPPASQAPNEGKRGDPQAVCLRLRAMLGTNAWAQDTDLRHALEQPLLRLCAHYLYKEKRRGYALNSVAHFHLKNGAVLWRINYEADLSARGLTNSCGIMVNYRYFLSDSESNSRQYQERQHITADPSVLALAGQATELQRRGDEEGVWASPA